ncbi:hypothetical protein O9993_00740 [Vibrio lentus]|nr:hypothetical protein [Vibrio lentus]
MTVIHLWPVYPSSDEAQPTTNLNVTTNPADPKIDDIDYLKVDADGDEVTSNAELILMITKALFVMKILETTEVGHNAIIQASVSTGDVDQSVKPLLLSSLKLARRVASVLRWRIASSIDGKVTLVQSVNGD